MTIDKSALPEVFQEVEPMVGLTKGREGFFIKVEDGEIDTLVVTSEDGSVLFNNVLIGPGGIEFIKPLESEEIAGHIRELGILDSSSVNRLKLEWLDRNEGPYGRKYSWMDIVPTLVADIVSQSIDLESAETRSPGIKSFILGEVRKAIAAVMGVELSQDVTQKVMKNINQAAELLGPQNRPTS